MNPGWLEILRVIAALGCGLMAGVFFAFSNFVMQALARTVLARVSQALVAVESSAYAGRQSGYAVFCFGAIKSFL